ncbi:adenylosuccinate lyase [Flavivirga rizhaonensis]|uniref:Adenylosuccinate lyase n=1 Tax=Flavivirga rizhaonensis TaxID=2559571 RepID=A0A4S1DX64_9FLAO|nr:adenylosuccinate lyase [Flavivirga rizhaonensis]TGV02740.1 adenylosuccinate lyase [Flavivirga rizhaonensis]
MTLEEFYKELSFVNASRENRTKYANIVLNDMSLFPKLIDILFMVNDKVSSRAAWILEFVCAEYIYAIVPHLETFTKNINKIRLDSSVRPVSKVCGFITEAYYSKKPNTIKRALTPKHKERIIEACFDWMIGDQKVAPKVYAMESLFLYGLDHDWIHPELTQILKQDFSKQSAAFKARAKRTLLKIKKSKAS